MRQVGEGDVDRYAAAVYAWAECVSREAEQHDGGEFDPADECGDLPEWDDLVAPGHDEDGPGNSENAPGHDEDGPGNSEIAPGQDEDGPGNSENAPGQDEDGPGNSENAPGQDEDGPDGSETAPGQIKPPKDKDE